MPNYEIHVIAGHVGGDPALKYTEAGVAWCTFSVAVNNPFKSDEPATWYRCSAWRAQAENAHQYVHKGDAVIVEGDRLTLRTWTGDDGNERTSLELNARRITFLGKRGDAPESGTANEPDELPF